MGWIWEYGRHFCLINRCCCCVYVSFCFPEGWLKGHETFHVAVVYVSHARYCCWFICSSPQQMCSHFGRYGGYICMMFIPVTEVSSLFISFHSSASHRQMTCQDGYEFIGGEQGTQPFRSAQWIGWFQLYILEGFVGRCFCQREETTRVKYPIRFFWSSMHGCGTLPSSIYLLTCPMCWRCRLWFRLTTVLDTRKLKHISLVVVSVWIRENSKYIIFQENINTCILCYIMFHYIYVRIQYVSIS